MKNILLILLCLPLFGCAQQISVQKDTNANYLQFALKHCLIYFTMPVKGLTIESRAEEVGAQNDKEKVAIFFLPVTDYRKSELAAGLKRFGKIDTLFFLEKTEGNISKQIIKFKATMPLTWSMVKQAPELVGKSLALYYMRFAGPKNTIEGIGLYDMEKDSALGKSFLSTFCTFYADSLDYAPDEGVAKKSFELNLASSNLEEVAGKAGSHFSLGDDEAYPAGGGYPYPAENIHYYQKKGQEYKTSDIFDDMDVRMKISEINPGTCTPDVVSIACDMYFGEMERLMGTAAVVEKLKPRRIGGLDVYEMEAKVYGKKKLLGVGYTAIFFRNDKYFVLHGYSIERPTEYLTIFKGIAESFRLTEK